MLLDYASWAEKNGIKYSADTKHGIQYQELDQIAAEQGVELKPGDILILRTGWIKWYNSASAEERRKSGHVDHAYCGFSGTPESIEWLWNHKFSAIAADNMSFEAWPATMPNRECILLLTLDSFNLKISNATLGVHDIALSLWGMPIGELWDLEALSEECKRQKRWSFLFTSAPLNISGGVASPPNALAIF